MRYRSIFALLFALLVLPAHAQSNKTAMSAQIATCFPDNTFGLITPAIVRTCLNSLIASYQQYVSVNAQTGATYTLQTTDYGTLVTFNNVSAVAVALPRAIAPYFPWNVFVTNLGNGTVTITPQTSTINGNSSLALGTGQSAWIVSDGTNYQVWSGSSGGGGSGNLVVGTTIINGGATNGMLYQGTGNLLQEAASVNNSVLRTNGAGVPGFSTALPNGITATTQSAMDNSTKLATTAYVDAAVVVGSVTSVFGRTGVVTAQSGDYTFAQIGSTPTTVAGYGITNALVTTNNLSDLTSASTARTNLGLGTFATQNAATPPAIGNTTPNSGNFTTLTTNSTLNIINGPFQFNGNPIVLPPTGANLNYQSGAFIPGDCLQVAAGVPGQNGAIADAGAACGSGGGGGGSVAHTQDFVASLGNFTPGVTTALTLATIPQSAASLVITFDGVTQAHDTWGLNLTSGIVSFNAAIPNNVQVVEAQWLTTAVGVVTGLSGDVTGSGSGVIATTIAANAVTYAKFQQVAASSLVGNPTGSLANAQGITLGATLGFSGTTLNCTTATNSLLGCVKPDGSTITISAGIISSTAAATSVTVGTTTINSGTNGDCLYDNAGVLGNQSCGTATSIAVGTTSVTSGTSGYILWNNGGTLANEQAITTGQMSTLSRAMAVLNAMAYGGI